MSENARRGPILDSHFHWYPQVVERAINESRGLTRLHTSDWSDLDAQLLRCRIHVAKHVLKPIVAFRYAHVHPAHGIVGRAAIPSGLELENILVKLIGCGAV